MSRLIPIHIHLFHLRYRITNDIDKGLRSDDFDRGGELEDPIEHGFFAHFDGVAVRITMRRYCKIEAKPVNDVVCHILVRLESDEGGFFLEKIGQAIERLPHVKARRALFGHFHKCIK